MTSNVYLRDCQHLIREGVVGLPGGFTKSGHPLLVFPDIKESSVPPPSGVSSNVTESDLHLLLKYYISVVPKVEKNPGFALVIDRRSKSWQEIQVVFNKIVTLFPAKIKEVFLLYQYPEGKPMLGKLVDDYLLDFDIFHVSHVTELLHYIDDKYLSHELGGTNLLDIDTWLLIQSHVDSFTHTATKCARRMATFVKILNKEDISLVKNRDSVRQIAERNRDCYRRLRKELEDLTEQGAVLGTKLSEEGATVMQRLAVQMLCSQLDNTWQYFTSTFKMQDQLYVQYVELYQFQTEYRELANKFGENEKIIKKLTVGGSSKEEVNAELDKMDSVIDAFSVDILKVKRLIKTGGEVMIQHSFARESLEPKITELRVLCKRQEQLFRERRDALIQFLNVFDDMEIIEKWNDMANEQISKLDKGVEEEASDEQDILSQIRQLDYLLSKVRDIKIKGRKEFEEEFDEIIYLLSAKTLFMVDDHLKSFDDTQAKVAERLEVLKQTALDQGIQDLDSVDFATRQENILQELFTTEESYVDDIESILKGYKMRLISSNNSNVEKKAYIIFGNLDQIYELHSQQLLPSLRECGSNIAMIARIFLQFSQQLTAVYCRYCQNMEDARAAVTDLGENHPLLMSCQAQLGHQLPVTSYLLKPVQRLTKYQLLLKELGETTVNGMKNENFELDECLEAMLSVIKAVNDSLHQINIKGLPEILHPLGSLVCQETFTVVTENKSQSQLIFRNRHQRRHLLLYENHLIFCKQEKTRKGTSYHFKFSLAISNMGMSSIIKGDERMLEIWIIGQSDVYSLQAKTKKSKEDFAAELRKVIILQKEKIENSNYKNERMAQMCKEEEIEVCDEEKHIIRENNEFDFSCATSGSGSVRSRRSCLSGSKSLDQDSGRYSYRSHSLDLENSDGDYVEGEDGAGYPFPKYKVLADYIAMTSRELNLHQGDVVELIKIGCAGWWFVRYCNERESSGWAPSTYLEKMPARQCRTLDRLEWRNSDRCDSVNSERANSGTLDRRKSRTLDWGESRRSRTPDSIEYTSLTDQENRTPGSMGKKYYGHGTIKRRSRSKNQETRHSHESDRNQEARHSHESDNW